MAAETEEPQSDDLLSDLELLDPLGGDSDGDADDADDGDALVSDGDSDSEDVVYVEVDEDEIVAIDADGGVTDTGDDSLSGDSGPVEVVDDYEDDSFDDGYDVDDLSIGDSDDLSPSAGFEDVEEE